MTDAMAARSPISKAARMTIRALALFAACLAAMPARSQETTPVGAIPGVIRDAETEQLLRDYVNPILHAAKVNSGATKIVLIGDRSFNAFVADGRKIFVNLGALMDSKTPNEIIGVLAHESGHIAGGHLAGLHQEMAHAQILSIVGMLAGAGAMVATARSNRPGSPVGSDSVGQIGALLGPQELVRRSLLAYVRGQEEAADRAAVTFLTATGQSGKGLLTTLERFQNDSLFQTSTIDPYLQTHPLPRERLSNLETVARASPFFDRIDPPALQARHDLMRAKLVGFVGTAGEVSRRYPLSDTSIAARYARAVSAYRYGRLSDALSQIDSLIAAQPANPYFYELKGQALLEGNRVRESIAPLTRAVAMAPQGYPIKVMLGHALLASDQPKEAVRVLTQVSQADPEDPEAFQYLSMAYDRLGDTPRAQLAAAQGFFLSGKYVEARTQADRARRVLPTGSPNWLKADDILNYRPPKFD